MVKFYVNRIERGLMTVDNVPKLWRAKVEQALAEKAAE